MKTYDLSTDAGTLDFVASFCHEQVARFAINRPWRHGQYVCATDGRVVIRWRSGHWDDSILTSPLELGDKFPPIDDLPWARSQYGTVCVAVPVMPEPTLKDCEECEGMRFVTCDYGHEHKCPECDGDGEVLANPYWKTGGLPRLGVVYAHKILAAGGKLFGRIDADPKKPIRFEIGDAIDGLLMPCREEEPSKGGSQ